MPELILKGQDLLIVLVDHLLNIEPANLKHLYRNELDKACFAHDAAYSDNKDLAKRNISDKVLKEKLMKMLEILNMMDIKEH